MLGENRSSGKPQIKELSEAGTGTGAGGAAGGSDRYAVVLGLKGQILVASVFFVVSAWLTVSTVSYVGSRNLLTDKTDYIEQLEETYADLLTESQVTTTAFVDRVEDLEATADRQRVALDELTRIQQTLQRQLESRERQLDVVARERDETQDRLIDLEQERVRHQQRLAAVMQEKLTVVDELLASQTRLAEVTRQRDTGRRVEQGLRWQVARLESQVDNAEENQETAKLWFKDWVVSSVDSLEQLFIGTGVDLEVLVARAAGDETGQGGPLQGVEAAAFDVGLGKHPSAAAITDNIRRLTALQKLASALPLASPLDHFHVTSHFGQRRDPFTRSLAFHGGLDFGAAPGSQVLATAPGRVVVASASGPYGNMVEIDHGMGVTTRYGHLKEITVDVGEDVGFRHPIGVIGSTGRSTGRHVHYEVRIDDQPLNPAKFLEAGRYLVDVFNFKQPTLAGGPAVRG